MFSVRTDLFKKYLLTTCCSAGSVDPGNPSLQAEEAPPLHRAARTSPPGGGSGVPSRLRADTGCGGSHGRLMAGGSGALWLGSCALTLRRAVVSQLAPVSIPEQIPCAGGHALCPGQTGRGGCSVRSCSCGEPIWHRYLSAVTAVLGLL